MLTQSNHHHLHLLSVFLLQAFLEIWSISWRIDGSKLWDGKPMPLNIIAMTFEVIVLTLMTILQIIIFLLLSQYESLLRVIVSILWISLLLFYTYSNMVMFCKLLNCIKSGLMQQFSLVIRFAYHFCGLLMRVEFGNRDSFVVILLLTIWESKD